MALKQVSGLIECLFIVVSLWSVLNSLRLPSKPWDFVEFIEINFGYNAGKLSAQISDEGEPNCTNPNPYSFPFHYSTQSAHQYFFQSTFKSNLPRQKVCINRRMNLDKRKSLGIPGASAQKLPDFTTERSIFTGLVTNPPPTPAMKDFEMNPEETSFATKAQFAFSWNSTYNITKILVRYTEKDGSKRTVEFPKLNLTSNYTLNIYPNDHPRKGFRYMIVGFTKKSNYYLEAWAFWGRSDDDNLYDGTYLKTGDSDRDERLYNLEGIFLVLGISTIIMVVVLCCIGYEKLLHQKKKQCMHILCCRRKSKRSAKVHNRGSISPEPLMIRRDPEISPVEDDFSLPGPSSKRR